MIRRGLIPVLVPILAFFGILLTAHDCPAQTDLCDPDPCQSIPNAVAGTCTEIGGACTGPSDYACSCDSGYSWQPGTHTCETGDQVTNFFLQNENGFLNIAHRGGGNLRPENTVLGYRHALSVGAEALEGDLHATQDGVVVVSHDATVDRTTNGSGQIKEMTFQELRDLDAGYWFTRDGGATYPYRGEGLQIPTLEEVFNDPVLDRAPMIAEIKQREPSIVDDVLDLVQTHAMEDQLILGSFSQTVVEEIRQEAGTRGMSIVTSFAEDEVLTFFFTPLLIMRLGNYIPPGKVLQVPVDYELEGINVQVISTRFMAKARTLGIKVQVWTVNDPEEMRWLINEMKVDGIMTDDPELLEEVINESSVP